MHPLWDWLREGLGSALFGLALLAAIFAPLERAFTARVKPRPPGALRVDLVFFGLQSVVMTGALVWVSRLLQLRLGPLAPLPLTVAVQRLPVAAQVALVVALGDLLLYWAHRASHAVPLLWRFHSVHHTAEALDWLAAQREHPLDGVYSHLALYSPAFFLGVDLAAVMPLLVFRALCANFVHSNVSLPLGPFGVLFGDPALHRWHHARVDRCAHNFANLAPYLDVLFGTHHRPGDEEYPLGVVQGDRPGVARLLVTPFFGEADRAPAAAASELRRDRRPAAQDL